MKQRRAFLFDGDLYFGIERFEFKGAGKMMGKFLRLLPLLAVACFGVGCFVSGGAKMPPLQYYETMERTAGEGEAEIVVTCLDLPFDVKNGVEIRVNGNVRFVTGKDKMTGTIVVPNGIYAIEANHPRLASRSGGITSINAKSSRTVLSLQWISDRFELSKYTEVALDKSASASQTQVAKGIDGAIKKAGSSLIEELPKGSKIAVVNVSSSDKSSSSLVVDELEFLLVSAKNFTIVDRSTLDLIRQEQNFQMGGDVSDDSVVRIGELTGANVVIAGSIMGSGVSGRLSLKALDVKTGQIIAMARESY